MKKLNSLILNITVNFLDFIYSGRNLQRFWVLEVIARSPYFAFLSVLHFKESLGIKNEKTMILMKEHFYQAINETEHLKEMEKRGGDRFWIDRFFARHLVLVYYWIMVFYYFLSPANAYDVNIKIPRGTPLYYVRFYSRKSDSLFSLNKETPSKKLLQSQKQHTRLKDYAPQDSWNLIQDRLKKEESSCPFNFLWKR